MRADCRGHLALVLNGIRVAKSIRADDVNVVESGGNGERLIGSTESEVEGVLMGMEAV